MRIVCIVLAAPFITATSASAQPKHHEVPARVVIPCTTTHSGKLVCGPRKHRFPSERLLELNRTLEWDDRSDVVDQAGSEVPMDDDGMHDNLSAMPQPSDGAVKQHKQSPR